MKIAYGECHCGCQQKTSLCPYTDPSREMVKGEPRLFLKGHHRRLSPVDYVIEDRGYLTPCWIWQLGTKTDGYGILTRDGVRMSAHRWYWEKKNGPLSEGLELHHLCRIPPCVNPDHVEPLTRDIHARRSSTIALSFELAAEIRAAAGSQRKIAARFGVSQMSVSRLKSDPDYWAS